MLTTNIGELSAVEKQRMEQVATMAGLGEQKRHNRANAFFKMMVFYMRSEPYKAKYGKYPLEEVMQWDDGKLGEALVLWCSKHAQFFHMGMQFDYTAYVIKRFSLEKPAAPVCID